MNNVEEHGNPVAGHGGVTGGPTGTHGAAATGGQVQPMKVDHDKTDGVLHRSGSSSSSSSEDDGEGGRRKKGMKEKIKEKLPGGQKDTAEQQLGATTTGAHGTGTATEATGGEKKSVMEKIKEKLPGGQQ
ncbi:unnamed protein product [Alopecurus aequalis]